MNLEIPSAYAYITNYILSRNEKKIILISTLDICYVNMVSLVEHFYGGLLTLLKLVMPFLANRNIQRYSVCIKVTILMG